MNVDAGASCPTPCDDGLFCNGVELCVEGLCAPGIAPCGGQLRCVEADLMCCFFCEMFDGDGDGVDSVLCGGADCDDDDAGRFPGNLEACDAVDQDCDPSTLGTTDADEDGAVSAACCDGDVCGPDCNEADAAVGPTGTEECNDADDDCDGDVDEGVQRLFWPDTDGDGFGALDVDPTRGCLPASGQVENTLDCADGDQTVNPTAAEVCNGADDNCNGTVDDPTLSAIACTTAFGSPARTTMACEEAACTIAGCGGSYQDCNTELSDGCETDTARDAQHCGACDNSCGLFAACVEGVCDRVVDVGGRALARVCRALHGSRRLLGRNASRSGRRLRHGRQARALTGAGAHRRHHPGLGRAIHLRADPPRRGLLGRQRPGPERVGLERLP
ncbi:MAG: putative metal-binding motif-containing protein [Sandaracinaceae bacterium]|nr:putative metal-binding motif-containing protein [Sandaracinaceae bacterium]